jgi:hypothetical protein
MTTWGECWQQILNNRGGVRLARDDGEGGGLGQAIRNVLGRVESPITEEAIAVEVVRQNPGIRGSQSSSAFLQRVRQALRKMNVTIANTVEDVNVPAQYVNDMDEDRRQQVVREFLRGGKHVAPDAKMSVALSQDAADAKVMDEERRRQVVAELVANDHCRAG